MATEKIPLVSVIIPMYNAAKFIPQTLESLLYQTMKDFEVLVVDDCSTDNSVEVVESLMPRFDSVGVKLHIIELSQNTGMPYLPRNVGIQFSRGKYLAFLDNDDFFTKTAFEELTTLAEKYQIDVINMSNFLEIEDGGENFNSLLALAKQRINYLYESKTLNLAVTEVPEDIASRIKLWLNNGFKWATWNCFCFRDFWIANQIHFPKMPVSDDTLANFACLCFAKKILLVPNICYIHRYRADSISKENLDAEKFFHRWLRNLIDGFKAFEEIMAGIPFFENHPDYRYAVLDWFFKRNTTDAQHFPKLYKEIHTAVLNQFVKKEFHSDEATFSAYLFNTVNIQKLQIMQLQQELAKFQKQ